MAAVTVPATLGEIRNPSDGRSYPRRLVDGCGDALVVFAAGFYGRQDAYWLARAGVRCTCVDNNADKLRTMAALYPDDWEFETVDAFEYARGTGRMWDVVSVDSPSNFFSRCAAQVGLWCDLARKAVVLGTSTETVLNVPAGWRITETRRRSHNYGGCYWTVLERDAG